MQKLVNKYVWLLTGMFYVLLAAKCVMAWDGGGGAALIGANLPHWLMLPVLMTVGVALANWLEPKILVDPEGAPELRKVMMLTLALILYVEALLLFIPLVRENAPRFTKLLIGGVGVFFIVLGVLMPKLKRNRLAGVRYTWTLVDAEVWRDSNRVGGRYTIILGLGLLVSEFVPQKREMFFSTFEIFLVIAYLVTLTLHSRLIALKKNPPQQ